MNYPRTLLVCVLLFTAFVGPLPAGPSQPSHLLLNKDLAVYRRSPTELWVYDTRPELGMGMHGMPDEQIDMVRALGIRLVRHTMYWYLMENTTEPGVYDPKYLASWDDLVQRCQQKGIELLAIVHGNAPGLSFENRQEAYHRFAQFVGAMAARYPSIRFWELWNEMDAGFTDLLAVHEQRAGAARTWLAAVERELVLDLELAIRQLVLCLNVVQLRTKPVVTILQLPILDVERPTSESASLGDNDPFRTAFRHIELGTHDVRLVLYIQDRVLHEMSHARAKRDGLATGLEIRPAS